MKASDYKLQCRDFSIFFLFILMIKSNKIIIIITIIEDEDPGSNRGINIKCVTIEIKPFS